MSWGESKDAELFGWLFKTIDTLVDLFLSVGSTKLDSDSCLVFGNHWEAESNHEDVVLLHHHLRHFCGNSSISKPDWGDGAFVMSGYLKAQSFHLGPEYFGVSLQIVDQVSALSQHFVCFKGCSYNRRSNRVREQVGPGLVLQDVNRLTRTRHEASGCSSHRLS